MARRAGEGGASPPWLFRPTACLYLIPLARAAVRLLVLLALQAGMEALGERAGDWPDLARDAVDLLPEASVVWTLLDLAVVGLAALGLARVWIARSTTVLAVAPDWIIHRSGLVRRRCATLHIRDAIGVDIEQGAAGLLFGFGTVDGGDPGALAPALRRHRGAPRRRGADPPPQGRGPDRAAPARDAVSTRSSPSGERGGFNHACRSRGRHRPAPPPRAPRACNTR